MKKNELIGSSIIIGIGIVEQLIVYYGSYLEKQNWSLVFEEAFQNIPYAIGNHIVLIICILFVIIKLKRNKSKS